MQRGQAQGVAGAITTNQLTVVWAEKDDPRTNTPFPHTIYADKLIMILTTHSDPQAKEPLPITAIKEEGKQEKVQQSQRNRPNSTSGSN